VTPPVPPAPPVPELPPVPGAPPRPYHHQVPVSPQDPLFHRYRSCPRCRRRYRYRSRRRYRKSQRYSDRWPPVKVVPPVPVLPLVRTRHLAPTSCPTCTRLSARAVSPPLLTAPPLPPVPPAPVPPLAGGAVGGRLTGVIRRPVFFDNVCLRAPVTVLASWMGGRGRTPAGKEEEGDSSCRDLE